MSNCQWRIDYRYQGCIGLSIAGFAPSERAAQLRADLLVRLAQFPISEIIVTPVNYKHRGKRQRLDRA